MKPIVELTGPNGQTFLKSQMNVGAKVADVFTIPNSEAYLYCITSMAAAIEKPRQSGSDWLDTKTAKALLGEDLTVSVIDAPHGGVYKLVNSKVATAYFIHWCAKGWQPAIDIVTALTVESLDIRAAGCFGELTSANISKIQQLTDEELATKARREARDEHNAFNEVCWRRRWSPRKVHDCLTKTVFGYTAQEARDNLPQVGYGDEVWTDDTVGINHQSDPLRMEIYRLTKKRMMSYRKGTYEERIERAFLEVTADIKLG